MKSYYALSHLATGNNSIKIMAFCTLTISMIFIKGTLHILTVFAVLFLKESEANQHSKVIGLFKKSLISA